MSKYPAPLPHDVAAEDIEFRKAFASAMIKGNQVSPTAQKPAPELGGSASGLVEIPTTPCLFPQPRFNREPEYLATGTTCVFAHGNQLRDGYETQYLIDAPEVMPCGSLRSATWPDFGTSWFGWATQAWCRAQS